MVVKVYVSGISGNKEVKKRQQRVLMILDSKSIQYEIIDITEPGKEDDKEFMQVNSKSLGGTVSDPEPRHPLPPQIFNDEEYCGDYDQFDMANELDTLEQFVKVEAPADPGAEKVEDKEKTVNGNAELGEKFNFDSEFKETVDATFAKEGSQDKVENKTGKQTSENGNLTSKEGSTEKETNVEEALKESDVNKKEESPEREAVSTVESDNHEKSMTEDSAEKETEKESSLAKDSKIKSINENEESTTEREPSEKEGHKEKTPEKEAPKENEETTEKEPYTEKYSKETPENIETLASEDNASTYETENKQDAKQAEKQESEEPATTDARRDAHLSEALLESEKTAAAE